MDKQSDIKIAEPCDRDRVKEGQEEETKITEAIEQIIKRLSDRKKLLLSICLIGLGFIIGWYIGFSQSYN